MNSRRFLKLAIGTIYYKLYYNFIKPKGCRVLIYHAFGTKLPHDYYGISINPKLFEDHIKYIKDSFKLLPIRVKTFNLNIDSVAISIDDGYKDTLKGVEILEKYNIPYTIYITTGLLNKKYYLTNRDLINLSLSNLCTLGTHTVNHVHLSKISKENQYKELIKCKYDLEDIIGKSIECFSYPYGDYDISSKSFADSIYSLISTSNIGINSLGCDVKMIKRIEIIGSDNLFDLKKKILGYYDFLQQKFNN